MYGAVQAKVTGVNLTAGAASTSAALPVDSSGRIPAYVRVTAVSAASAHVRVGPTGLTALATDQLVVGASGSALVRTEGSTHVAVIQEGTGGVVNVTPA